MRRPRVLHAARHARQRALVQHRIHTHAGLRNGVGIRKVAFHEVHAARHIRQLAGRQVIEPAHTVAALQQCLRKVRPDEACSAVMR